MMVGHYMQAALTGELPDFVNCCHGGTTSGRQHIGICQAIQLWIFERFQMAPSHFGTFDPTAGVIDARGHFLWQHVPENIQYDLPDRDLRVSADGGLVLLHYSTLTPSRGRVERYSEFEVAHRAISLDVDPDLSMPLPNTTGLDIEHWHNSPKPTLNGQVLKLYSHEISRSVAVSSKADVFLLGADWSIRLFDKTGREKWHVNVPAGAFAVNLTGDGRYAVAALEDGSIRWYAVESGHEVMGLFIDADGKRWVLWTPEGFFDCSAASDALVGYHVNRGPDHDGEFVRDDQLSFLLFRPHLLSARLSAEGDELVKAEVAHIGDVYEALQSGLPPEVASLSPAESESDGKLTLQYRVIDRGGGIGDVVYRIDRAVMAFRPVGPLPEGKDTVGREFDLPPGRHVVTVTVYNRSNKVESRSISAVVNVRNTQTQQKLYVVAVGISRYRDAGAVPLLVGICVYIFIERGCPELR